MIFRDDIYILNTYITEYTENLKLKEIQLYSNTNCGSKKYLHTLVLL